MIAAAWQSLRNGDYPIITLEWRRMMRGKLRLRLLLLAAGVTSAVGFFGVLSGALGAASGTASRLGSLPVLGYVAVVVLLLIQQAVLWLVIPLYAARSIAAQRETRALQMIAVTPMKSRFIVGQIMAVVLGQALAVAVVSLPALIALHVTQPLGEMGMYMLPFSGGLMGQIWFPVTAAFYASVGLLCSCSCATLQSAIILTYVLAIFLGRLVPTGLYVVPMLLGLWRYWSHDPATMVTLAIVGRVMLLVLAVLFTWMAINRFDRLRRGLGGAGW